MTRGVYKKIIEVNDTQNEYFERAILIVKEDKRQTDLAVLKKQAGSYLMGLGSAGKPRRWWHAWVRNRWKILCFLLAVGLVVLAFQIF